MRRFAVFFDLDKDSCYPSPAISPTGVINGGMSVTEIDTSYVLGCREPTQLEQLQHLSPTRGHREKRRHLLGAHVCLVFHEGQRLASQPIRRHSRWYRHDWEFALVWTTNDKLTHAYVSQHSGGDLEPISKLHFDAWCPECVKVVYHKNGGTTHAMRFAKENEKAENDTK